MKNNLINEILENKLNCVIISPHHDDAVLSCAELLSQLKGKTTVTVVNLFTASHDKPYTLSIKQFLKASGYSDALSLYDEREKEDKRVLSSLGVSIINLGLEDALFRRKKKLTFLGQLAPEVDHIYATYRWHLLKGPSENDFAADELRKKLQGFANKKNIVFAPYAIGGHVDHILARKVSEELFDNLILYSDFPYNVRLHTDGKEFEGKEKYIVNPDYHKKVALIKGYKTQFNGLFPNGIIPNHEEIYFRKK
jgi:LmbE family N-acetylglucosaminyl deacetylase